jgi:hypothetical protein
VQGVPPRIVDVSHDLVERVGGACIELSSHDRAVIGDANEDHSSPGVGKSNYRLLNLIAGDPGLELDEIALCWEFPFEFLWLKGERKVCTRGMKWGI